MSQTSDNNKRIAKNTLLLYFRMLFMMAVSLYTSRVILNTLGVEDYGIYNVVGGIVAMFGFINSSMSSATQRYITFALGKGDVERLKKVFSTTLQIHVLIAAIIVLLGETVGLWFMYTQMQIPADRMDAAFWVLQCSIASTVIMIISVPYNADIIAHEKMSAFAYISILEVVLKLAIVYMLVVFSVDKLVLYAFLLLGVQLLMRFCYSFYCNKHFEETKYNHVWDKTLFKEMTGFAGWNMFGNLAGVLFGQGLNMLLNVFFGPVVNAARGVAVQVQNAVQQFVGNFQMALNPQITKTYAKGEMEEMHKLMFRSARFSFFLLFFLSLPVLFETNFILTLWLKTVPEHTVVFLRIMICTSLIYTLSNPLIVANQATGKVKKYQAICGSILLLILPVSYICLRLGCPAYSVFIVHFAMESLTQLVRMFLLRPLIGIRIRDYFNCIYLQVIVVIMTSSIIPCLIFFNMEESVLRFFAVGFACAVSVPASAYFLGLSSNEKVFVRMKAVAAINKNNEKMIKLTDKKDCCGCSACVQKCPKHCIALVEDNEGFLYPQVDETACVNCGLCEKVCPILNRSEKIAPKEVLAVKNRNEEDRMNSSSGGVFIALAKEVVGRGGVVFGAVYDESWEVHHVYAEKLDNVYPMMGSKYVQSRTENTYKEAELFLKQGREVLFVGTPCQIAGLKAYLRDKDYPNLLAVDFICHGVPSPGVWRQYLAETYGGYDAMVHSRRKAAAGKNTVLFSSLNAKSPIGDIKFRDKYGSGWKKFRFVVHGKSASKADRNSVLSSDIHYDNPYMRGFLSDIYLRPSCYECKCKNGVSHSDLTIADYWAARVTDQDFDDDKGISLVLVNTVKGKEYFVKLDMAIRESTMDKARLRNGGFKEHTRQHSKRDEFYFLLNNESTVESSILKCFEVSLVRRILNKIKARGKKCIEL